MGRHGQRKTRTANRAPVGPCGVQKSLETNENTCLHGEVVRTCGRNGSELGLRHPAPPCRPPDPRVTSPGPHQQAVKVLELGGVGRFG